MYLLLVRHGESVDNVAGLYAGSRDSPLTNHGVLQARRLGTHLASRRDTIGPITHVFASNLERAKKTASVVAEAQATDVEQPIAALNVVQLTELREKDFGSDEGKKYRSTGEGDSRNAAHSDSESRESMMVRVNRFIDFHLLPVLESRGPEKSAVLITAHGIILNVLLRALATRFPESSSISSDYSAAWSNTGVLQATIENSDAPEEQSTHDEASGDRTSVEVESPLNSLSPTLQVHKRFAFVVQFINNTDHLNGLKKTKGGIGSQRFDPRQMTINTFFNAMPKKGTADRE